MIFKLLVLCTMVCSVFAATETENLETAASHTPKLGGKTAAEAVADIIFRNAPKLKKLKKYFIDHYPKETSLEDPAGYDRGYNKSVADPFFATFLKEIAKMVDNRSLVHACDFGFGKGHTTFLIALTGAPVLGIEKMISVSEYTKSRELYDYYNALSQKISQRPLMVMIKPNIDATLMPDRETYARSNDFNCSFAGNLMHMFSPDVAKKFAKEQVHRMLRKGGFCFASVDGIIACAEGTEGEQNAELLERQKVYREAKTAERPFPSVITQTTYGIKVPEEGENYSIELIKGMQKISSAEVTKEGKTLKPCRERTVQQFHFEGTATCLHQIKTISCCYDTELIRFVFPEEEWDVSYISLDRQWNQETSGHDENVTRYNIVARKK